MNERNLLCFLKVYQLGNIHRAAEELYLSAQAVSKTINRLEQELGETLFVRTREGMYPTRFADRLKERAEAILYQYEKIREDFKEQSDVENNIVVLRIASSYGVLRYLSIDFLKGFYEKYPNIHLNFVEYPDYPIYEMMKKGQIDLAFLSEPIDANLMQVMFCFSHKFCVVMNENHPLAKKKSIEYTDLNNIPVALKGHDYSFFPVNVSRFAKGGLKLEIQLEISDEALIVESANKNCCVGILADYLARDYAVPHTVIVPFADEGFVRNIFLAWRKDTRPSYSAECFINYVEEWVENNGNEQ